MKRPELLGRYVEPGRIVPLTPRNVARVVGSLSDAWREGAVARFRPAAVGIDVSDACNIACAVCSREIAYDRRQHPFMKLATFQAIFDQIRPVYLSLSGYGETLLNKDIYAIIAHARAAGSEVALISNGTLLDDARAQRLVEARLTKLKISIDSPDPATYAQVRAGAELEEVLQNVARLRARPGAPQVELQMVLFEENVHQAADMVALCAERLPGVQPNFMVMFTYGDQAGFVEKTLHRGDDRALSAIAAAREAAVKAGFRRTVGALDAARVQLTQDLSSSPCYVPWYSCLISTDGEVYPCCHHSIRGTSVGNVLEEPFDALWNGPRMQAFRASLRDNRCGDKVCARCRYEDRPMDQAFSVVNAVPGVARLRGDP